ncbi:MAG: response regulator [Balneolales bacterium]|nr:response regulator [Balneolales bacterium]
MSESLKILIVEDVMLNMMLIKKLVRVHCPDATILEATDGQQGVNIFIEQQPDIIFMDIHMPVLDGYLATQSIRSFAEENALKQPIVVALTAGTTKLDQKKANEAGMDDFLAKPLDISLLKQLLDRYLS